MDVALIDVPIAPPTDGPSPPSHPGPGRAWPRRIWRASTAVAPAGLAGLPFLILLVRLAVERPAITAYGDRALTALAVRDLLGGHQLLGAYSRYGWHHPGPAFFVPLALAHVALGDATWGLDAAMLVATAVPAVALVALVTHRRGRTGGLLCAGAVGGYLHAVGPSTFRDPWNPWALLFPLALLVAVAGAAGTGSLSALAGGVLITSVLIQTHVGAAPVAVALLATAVVLSRTSRAPRSRREWVVALAAGAVTAGLWIPPLVQEATGRDPNLTELWLFFVRGDPGHSLSTAVAAVGARLLLVPFGTPRDLLAASPSVPWNRAGSGWALAAYLAVAIAVTVVGRRRADHFAAAVGTVSAVALVAAVFAVRSIQGSLDGFLLAWITALPLGLATGVASLVCGWRGTAGSRASAITTAAVTCAVAGTAMAVAAALAAPPARSEDAPEVHAAWTSLAPRLARTAAHGDVLMKVNDPYAWPVEAGLALLIEEHGWHARVEDDWTFMFGDGRRSTGSEPVVVDLRPVDRPRPGEPVSLSVTPGLAPLDDAALASVPPRLSAVLQPVAGR